MVSIAPARLPAANARGGWMQREQQLMGCALTVQLWADDRSQGAAAMAAVSAEVQRIDRLLGGRRADAELATAGAAAVVQPVRLGDELFRLLLRAQALARLTQGAFDVSCGALVDLYRAQGEHVPDDLRLARALQDCGWRHLLLDQGGGWLRLLRPGMRIDLVGLRRGYAVDRSIVLLQRLGIRHALVSAGRDSRVLGDRRGSPWTLTLPDIGPGADPLAAPLALLPLHDAALACATPDGSGGGPGVLDPRSGARPAGLRSAHVVAPDSLSATALAKALLVLGAERGLALAEQVATVEVVLVDDDGRLLCSSGLQAVQAPALLRPAAGAAIGQRERA